MSIWCTWRICRRRPKCRSPDHDTLLQRQIAFGYTFEDQRVLLDADGQERRRGGRLHGQRCRAGGAVDQAAAAVRLFQAAVRAGDQSADRLHPRGAHHRLRGVARVRGQPADAAAGGLPPPGTAVARSSPTRSSRRSGACTLPGLKVGVLLDPVPRHARRAGSGQVHRGAAPGGAPHGGGRGGQHPHPQRSRREPRVRRRAVAPGGLGAAPLSDPRGTAHARQPGAGDRRGARGASLLAAHRLRLQRHQSRTWRSRRSTA